MAGLLCLLLAACGAKTGLLDEERVRDDAAPERPDGGADAGRDAGEDAGRDAAVPAGCGDGVVGPGEECDEGPLNADVSALVVRQVDEEWEPEPIGSTRGPVDFYDYRSESAHTGHEGAQQVTLFAYRDWDLDDTFLFFVFSRDDGGFDGTAQITI